MVNNEGLFVYPLCKNDFLPPKLIFGSGQSGSKGNKTDPKTA